MELSKFDLGTFDCVSPGVGSRWTRWKRAFEIYASARKINDQKQKCSLLLHCGGMQIQDIFFTLPGDLSKYEDATVALTNYFQPSSNVPYERHVFRSTEQRESETIEQYVTRLRQKAETCDFNDMEQQIRDQVIEKCSSNILRKKFLEKGKDLTLTILREIARAYETSAAQVANFSNPES